MKQHLYTRTCALQGILNPCLCLKRHIAGIWAPAHPAAGVLGVGPGGLMGWCCSGLPDPKSLDGLQVGKPSLTGSAPQPQVWTHDSFSLFQNVTLVNVKQPNCVPVLMSKEKVQAPLDSERRRVGWWGFEIQQGALGRQGHGPSGAKQGWFINSTQRWFHRLFTPSRGDRSNLQAPVYRGLLWGLEALTK